MTGTLQHDDTPLPGEDPPEASVEDALHLAVAAHRGQRDKAGAPYAFHPIRVALRMATDAERMTALLHDVVEDCGVSPDALVRQGFPADVVEAVSALTRREGEAYEAFIGRAAGNPIARRVKIADLEDNMDARRIGALTERDLSRLARYHAAWRRLTALP